jgi:hypothetical protein
MLACRFDAKWLEMAVNAGVLSFKWRLMFAA